MGSFLAKRFCMLKLLKTNTVKSKKKKMTVPQSSLQITEDTKELTQKF